MATKKKWMESANIVELSEMLKAIAHPSRMAIMFLLCNDKNKKMTVKCVYEQLNMPQPVISRHLGILKNSGLLRRVVKGSKTFYEIEENNKNVQHISKCFTS